jgi:flagellar biosynthesis protein FlhG
MNWTEARELLQRATHGPESGTASAPGHASQTIARARSLCVASGKGGTGKSIVCAALGRALARRGRSLLLDADLGVGNAHILQGASPRRSAVDLIEGRCDLRGALVRCAEQLDLLAAGCGVSRMASLTRLELEPLARGLCELETEYDYTLVDSAAGVSEQTLCFAVASDLVLLVTTPDLTAMTDAYAFFKVLRALCAHKPVLLLVNRAGDAREAEHVAQRIEQVAERFLGAAPRLIGWLPEDRAVQRCANRRSCFFAAEPQAPASLAFETVAACVALELEGLAPHGLGAQLLG